MLLLFTNAFGSPGRATLDGLRLELSALGCALLVVGDPELFYFNSRPANDGAALAASLGSAGLTALRQTYGGARRHPGVSLSLLEPDGRERFRLSRKLRASIPDALLEALQIARQSVNLPTSFGSDSKRDLLLYSLVGALNLVLGDAQSAPSVHRAQA